MNMVNPSKLSAPLPVTHKPVVSLASQFVHSHPQRRSTEPVDGITSSGGTIEKIVKHATQQIEKSVVRASAKLETDPS